MDINDKSKPLELRLWNGETIELPPGWTIWRDSMGRPFEVEDSYGWKYPWHNVIAYRSKH